MTKQERLIKFKDLLRNKKEIPFDDEMSQEYRKGRTAESGEFPISEEEINESVSNLESYREYQHHFTNKPLTSDE